MKDAGAAKQPPERSRTITILVAVTLGLILLFASLNPLVVPVTDTYAQEAAQLTWSKFSDAKPHAMAFSPHFASDRLALYGSSNKEQALGIWRTTDGGETWEKSSEGIPEKKQIFVYEIHFSPDYDNDLTIYISVNKQKVTLREANGALYRSTDAGQTWEEIELSGFPMMGVRPSQSLLGFDFSPNYAQDHTLFAVEATKSVFRSTDGGSIWEEVLKEKGNDIAVMSGAGGETVIAVTTDASGVFFSADNGDTWETRNTGIEGVRNFKQVLFSANFAQDKSLLIMSTTEGVFITYDAGASWQNIVKPPANDFLQAMAATPGFQSEGFLAYALRSGEVFLTEDLGQTWLDTDAAGLLGAQVEGLFMQSDYASSRTMWASSGFSGLYRHYPVEAGSEVALAATAVAVGATATTEAVATALAERQVVQADIRESGCITYTIPPFLLLGVWLARYRKRDLEEEGA